MPAPGMSSMPESRSANWSSPWARNPAITCSWLMPDGRSLLMTPLKITSIALPSTRGAMTLSTTAMITITSTTAMAIFSGLSSPKRRFADGQKCLAFLAGTPPNMSPSASVGWNSSSSTCAYASAAAPGVGATTTPTPGPVCCCASCFAFLRAFLSVLTPLPPPRSAMKRSPGTWMRFPPAPRACRGPLSARVPSPESGPHP